MADREKLEVIAHLSDHITYKEGIGICYDSALAKVIEDAYMTLKNGVTIPKWIPVTERLPQEDGRYMCNVKSFAFPGSFYQTILKYDKYGFREGHIYTDDVTHWMPLPEPPKGE